MAMYTSLGGPDWLINSGWAGTFDDDGSSATNPCGPTPWHGLTCNTTGNASHVTEISLVHNNLAAASLQPAALALHDLPHLTHLDLSNNGSRVSVDANRIHGALPEEICGVGAGSLEVLSLMYNNISGTLPACLDGDAMPRLSVLNLGERHRGHHA